MKATKKSALSQAVKMALYGTAALAVATPVLAQDDAEQLETIQVIGSRIKRTDIETSQPVFVIEREDLQKTGLTSVGDILQDLTTNGAALNTTFNNGGNGETQIDLRNLTANRTLVLVNGKRWVSGLGGAVDLNTIPVTIIERVEVLKDGASAIYGSDAIAGVVNITTRDTYDGAEASAYLGENEEGDGRTELYDFTIGSSTDRASVVMNASYTKQEPIFAGDREISANPLFGFNGNNVNVGASSTTPFGRFGFGSTGGRLPNGAPGTLTLIPGRAGTAAGDFTPFDLSTAGYNFAPDNYLLTPQERIGIYVQGRYQITDDISFNTSIVYNERKSEQQLAAFAKGVVTEAVMPTVVALMAATTSSSDCVAGSTAIVAVPPERESSDRPPVHALPNNCVRRSIGIVPQQEGIFEMLTAFEFVRLAAVLHELPDPEAARESALHAIGKIGTVEALDFLCDRLREGERPFVELASTAIRNLSNPDLLPYLRRQIEFVPAEHRAVLEDSAQHLEQRLR